MRGRADNEQVEASQLVGIGLTGRAYFDGFRGVEGAANPVANSLSDLGGVAM